MAVGFVTPWEVAAPEQRVGGWGASTPPLQAARPSLSGLNWGFCKSKAGEDTILNMVLKERASVSATFPSGHRRAG